jgi:hypothetical protein
MCAIKHEVEGQRYLLRNELRGWANMAFLAVGLRPSPSAQPLDGATDV